MRMKYWQVFRFVRRYSWGIKFNYFCLLHIVQWKEIAVFVTRVLQQIATGKTQLYSLVSSSTKLDFIFQLKIYEMLKQFLGINYLIK